MKTKLILSTQQREMEFMTILSFTPRIDEWFNIPDILKTDEWTELKQSAKCWTGIHGTVKSVEYRHDENDFYQEIKIRCED
jgi:hypothetical protein